MSTDEFSQDIPEEVYMHRTPSAASSSYPPLGNPSSCSMPMTSNLDLNAMASMSIRGQMATQQQEQNLSLIQRQKRKYTRRKNPEERKRRGPRTKDVNAPRMPLNGYVRFLNANRDRIKQENPELNFAEVTKRLAAEWSGMSTEEKKAYLDEAEKAKEIYLKELHEYQQTESYQEFMEMKQRSRQPQQQQQQQQSVPLMTSSSQNQMYRGGQSSQYFNDHTNQYPMYNQQQQMYQPQQSYPAYNVNGNLLNGTSSGYPPYYGNTMVSSGYSCASYQRPCNYPGSIPNQNILNGDFAHSQLPSNSVNNNLPDSMQENGSMGSSLQSILQRNSVVDLPIFTEEFLEHNKLREQDLRNLRAFTMEYEEANAISSKHVDDMLKACDILAEQEQKEKTTNERLKTILEQLQQSLISKMSHLTIPRYMLINDDKTNSDGTISSDSSSPNEIGPPTIDTFDMFVGCLNKLRLNQSIQQCKTSEPLLESIRSAIVSLDEIVN